MRPAVAPTGGWGWVGEGVWGGGATIYMLLFFFSPNASGNNNATSSMKKFPAFPPFCFFFFHVPQLEMNFSLPLRFDVKIEKNKKKTRPTQFPADKLLSLKEASAT